MVSVTLERKGTSRLGYIFLDQEMGRGRVGSGFSGTGLSTRGGIGGWCSFLRCFCYTSSRETLSSLVMVEFRLEKVETKGK